MAVTDSVHSSQRTSKTRRCVICGGASGDARGKQRRCYGFISSDKKFAHCTREEHAGALQHNKDSDTYAHRLNGKCACGTTHGPEDPVEWNGIETAYDYRDERGQLLYQVVRKIPKDFRQRKPNGLGGWDWSIGAARRIIYRLPQLLKSPPEQTVYIVEGEKDVDRLTEIKLIATTNPQGAGKWHFVDECAKKALQGRHLVIIADADSAGREHAEQVKEWALTTAASIRVLHLYPDDSKRDVSDWLNEGHTADELAQIAASIEPIETGIHADPWIQELTKAREDVDRAIGTYALHERKPLFGIDAVDLLRQDFPAVPWLVSGLVTKGGTAVAAGEPKAGIKTWLLIELAVSIATGTRAFGEFYAEKGRAAIFFAEDQAQSVRNRVRAILEGGGRTIAPGSLLLQPRGEFIDVLKDDDLAWLIASARRLGKIDLLVIDPLRDVHSGVEDKSDSMRDVMRRLRLLGEVIGCTIAVSHHVPKQTKDTQSRRPGQNLRGSSAIHGSIDSGLYIQPGDDGNGTTNFQAGVVSQVKNARSAGAFGLDLAIEDDANGEALRASWSFSSQAPQPAKTPAQDRKAERDASDDQKVFDYVRAKGKDGTFLTQKAIRAAISQGGSDWRARSALERLLRDKRLFVSDGVIRYPGWDTRD